MIGMLRGILLELDPPYLLLEVAGIGYELQVPVGQFSEIGSNISLYVHTVTREDGTFLYGFVERAQRTLFRALIKVSGIGPKLGLAILSAMDPATFAQSLLANDAQALERIPGVGGKTAKRLMVEMKDRIGELHLTLGNSAQVTHTAMDDAVRALVALGYKAQEAQRVLDQFRGQECSNAELIRLALQRLG